MSKLLLFSIYRVVIIQKCVYFGFNIPYDTNDQEVGHYVEYYRVGYDLKSYFVLIFMKYPILKCSIFNRALVSCFEMNF